MQKHRVYRALDRPASFMGIKGKFIVITGILMGVSVVLSLVVGSFAGALWGLGVLFFLGAVSVLVTFYLQGRMTVRQFSRFLTSRLYPDYIKLPPRVPFTKIDLSDENAD